MKRKDIRELAQEVAISLKLPLAHVLEWVENRDIELRVANAYTPQAGGWHMTFITDAASEIVRQALNKRQAQLTKEEVNND